MGGTKQKRTVSVMKLKLIKEVTFLSSRFNMVYDKTSSGGSFSYATREIKIGTKNLKSDPAFVLSIISHEIMEAILVSMGARWDNTRVEEYYHFHFDHQTFEDMINVHTQVLIQFIQTK